MNGNILYKNRIVDIVIKQRMYRDPDFSAGKLAETLGVPNYKLSRIMQAEFGMSYADLVLARRVEEAKRLLQDERYSPYTVDDIGVMVGFKNRQSFFDAFKKYGGMTPEKWRKSPLSPEGGSHPATGPSPRALSLEGRG